MVFGYGQTYKPAANKFYVVASKAARGAGLVLVWLFWRVLQSVKMPSFGANSVFTHDVPDYCIVAGNPARILSRIKPELEIK